MDNAVSPSRLVSAFALTGIAIWTLLGLGAWVIVGFGGDVLQAVIGKIFWSDPEMGRVVGGLGRILEGLGVGLVLFVWAFGAAIIWGGWALLRRLAQAHVVMAEARFDTDPRFEGDGTPPGAGWGQRPMKDVTPPRDTQIPPPPRSLPPR
jgi:hypothetical protein